MPCLKSITPRLLRYFGVRGSVRKGCNAVRYHPKSSEASPAIVQQQAFCQHPIPTGGFIRAHARQYCLCGAAASYSRSKPRAGQRSMGPADTVVEACRFLPLYRNTLGANTPVSHAAAVELSLVATVATCKFPLRLSSPWKASAWKSDSVACRAIRDVETKLSGVGACA